MTAGFFQWHEREQRGCRSPLLFSAQSTCPLDACYKVKGQKEGIGVGIFWVELGALVYLGSVFVSVFCWCHGVCLKSMYF